MRLQKKRVTVNNKNGFIPFLNAFVLFFAKNKPALSPSAPSKPHLFFIFI
ncbi:hypothetical protein CHCC20335_1723 [Bacillus paralicheniformis]|nr:hypothetical protein CHCC20335_1723 [Bacillus paralicheniformis]